MQTNSLETQVKNLDGKENYVILETEGEGNYIGCNHSVTHFQGVSEKHTTGEQVLCVRLRVLTTACCRLGGEKGMI
jgi:hypothetical protein